MIEQYGILGYKNGLPFRLTGPFMSKVAAEADAEYTFWPHDIIELNLDPDATEFEVDGTSIPVIPPLGERAYQLARKHSTNRILAIKALRAEYALGLLQAKDFVEIAQGRVRQEQAEAQAREDEELDLAELSDAALAAYLYQRSDGRSILAIKALRAARDLGLREAKDLVDAAARDQVQLPAEP